MRRSTSQLYGADRAWPTANTLDQEDCSILLELVNDVAPDWSVELHTDPMGEVKYPSDRDNVDWAYQGASDAAETGDLPIIVGDGAVTPWCRNRPLLCVAPAIVDVVQSLKHRPILRSILSAMLWAMLVGVRTPQPSARRR